MWHVKLRKVLAFFKFPELFQSYSSNFVSLIKNWNKRQSFICFQLKALKSRQLEAEKVALERAKEKANRDRDEMERTSRAVAGINHLEIPAELAFIFSKLEGKLSFFN